MFVLPKLAIRDYVILGLIVLFGTTGALWWRARDARLRAEGAYAVQLHIADSLRANATVLKASADSSKAVSDSVISHEDPRIAAAARERDRALSRANAAQAAVRDLESRIVGRFGPSDTAVARTAVTEATDSILSQVVAPLRFALTRSDSIVASQAREIASLKETVDRTGKALDEATKALNARVAADASLAKSTPGFVTRTLEKVAFGLGGAVVGYFVAKD